MLIEFFKMLEKWEWFCIVFAFIALILFIYFWHKDRVPKWKRNLLIKKRNESRDVELQRAVIKKHCAERRFKGRRKSDVLMTSSSHGCYVVKRNGGSYDRKGNN